MKKVAIIGSGIGGLATAARLASLGMEVHVFEKNAILGGKVHEIQEQGYRFDTGPSLFTLPSLADDLFNFCGENPRDYFKYKKLDIITSYFYEDNTVVHAYADEEKLLTEFEEKLLEPKQNLKKFLHHAADIYELTKDLFIFNAFHKIRLFVKYFPKALLWRFPTLSFFNTMSDKIDSFFTQEKTRQFFKRYATYNGSNPYKAPATLNVIAHLEHNIGAFFIEGGMRNLVHSLEKLCIKKQVHFHTNSPVELVYKKNNLVEAIEVNKQKIDVDYVVYNGDINAFYSKLLRDEQKDTTLKKQALSTSAFILFLGIKKTVPSISVHNILFAKDYKKEFDTLEKKEVYIDPTTYIYVSSKLAPSDAPEGSENWFVMINVPSTKNISWQKQIPEIRSNILNKIHRVLKIDIEPYIEFEKIYTPEDLENQTGSILGALYGASSNNMFSAFLRHPNFSNQYKNVFFCGGSVHPGGGIPLCLSSAKIVQELISKNPL